MVASPGRGAGRRLAVAVAVVALAAVPVACSKDGQAELVGGPTTSRPTARLQVTTGPTWTAADATSSVVGLYEAPGRPDPGGRTLTNPTPEDMPLVFSVKRREGDWVQVGIPSRPNGATAWVRASDVRLRTVPYRIEVALGARKLTLYKGDDVVLTAPIAVGADGSPTPVGHFYVDAAVILADPTGPYGAGQVSVSGFSDVYQSFGGGQGQIAIHGTNQPGLIGDGVSHGCVRVTNDVVLKLLHEVPTGAPVDIVA